MSDGVSIIICCYNSSALLPKTLLHIAKQQVQPGLEWELIIVDNASTDNTAYVAINEWKQHNIDIPFKVVPEAEPGLLKARIRGYKEAKFDFLIYCDDDNWLSKNYVANAYRILQSNPNIGACGGHGIPEFETGKKPEWFIGHLAESFALGAQAATDEGPVKADRYYVYGAGMVIRKAAIEAVYSDKISDSLLLSGRKGNALSAGDDSEVCFYILLKGYKLWYSNKLTFFHFLQTKRLDKSYVHKLYKGFGKSIPYVALYHSNFTFISKKERKFLSNWSQQILLQMNIAARNYLLSFAKKDRKYISIMHFEAAKQLWAMRKNFKHVKRDLQNLIATV